MSASLSDRILGDASAATAGLPAAEVSLLFAYHTPADRPASNMAAINKRPKLIVLSPAPPDPNARHDDQQRNEHHARVEHPGHLPAVHFQHPLPPFLSPTP